MFINKAALTAVASLKEQAPMMYTVMASYPDHPKPRLANQDAPAHIVLDVSSVIDKKVAAARCHLSQNELFVRRTSEDMGRPVKVAEVVMDEEALHRVYPEMTGENIADDKFIDLLAPWQKG